MNLLGKTSVEIADLLQNAVDRDFRGRQIAGWIHQRDARTFEEMSNIPKSLREALAVDFSLAEPEVLERAVRDMINTVTKPGKAPDHPINRISGHLSFCVASHKR